MKPELQHTLNQVTSISETLKMAGFCGELVNLYRFPNATEPSWYVTPCLLPADHPKNAYGEDRHTGTFEIPLPECCTTAPVNTCWCPKGCCCTCGIESCYPCYNEQEK